MPASDSQPLAGGPSAWILLSGADSAPAESESASPQPRVWGLTAVERLRRALARSGARPIEVLDSQEPAPNTEGRRCVLARSDYLYDERLIQALVEAEPGVLLDPRSGEPVAALVGSTQLADAVASLRQAEVSEPGPRLSGMPSFVPSDLVPAYHPALRKLDPPLLCRLGGLPLREVEDRIFNASYKGLTDLVTKWVWPTPARIVTRWLANRNVRPNTVTYLSYALALLVVWLFARGSFGAGLAAAWMMTFLDTVDGKLARVTLTSSRLGGVLDHGLDLVHPPVWWVAWAYGLAPGLNGFEWATGIVVGGYLLGRILEGVFILSFGMEVFLWRRFDGFFRTIVARRNPNLILLSLATLAGRPDWGFLAVAAWTLACNAIQLERLAQALVERIGGTSIQPWQQGWQQEQPSHAAKSGDAAGPGEHPSRA